MTNRAIAVSVLAVAILTAACGSGESKPQPPETTAASSALTTAASSGPTAAPQPTTTTVPALTQAQLASAVLAVTDLPTGWSTTPPSTDKKGACNKDSVNKAVPPAAMTEADFVKGSDLPLFGDQLLAYSDAATAGRALDKYVSNASACTSFKQDGTQYTIGQLSVPPLGDRSIGYRLTLTKDAVTGVIDTEVMQRGPLLVYVGYGDFSPDTEQLATFAKLAYDKAVNTLHPE